MGKIKVERTKNYTTISNLHLRDKNISLKAKGLLTVMLSLPDDWDYTIAGLSTINKEGVDSISSTLKELEKYGYVVRKRVRNALGQVQGTDYTVYEKPYNSQTTTEQANSEQIEPKPENPIQANPRQADPRQENPVQLNKDIINNLINKYIKSNNQSNNKELDEFSERLTAKFESTRERIKQTH